MGFPPSGSGHLIDPSTLQATDKRKIDRRIFGPLPDNILTYIKKYRDKLTVTFDIRALTEDGGAYYESDSDDDFHPKRIEPINLYRTAVRVPPLPQRPIIDLNWFDFNILFNSRPLDETKGFNDDGDKRYMRPTTRTNTIEQNIAMICGHANTIRRAALPEDKRLDENGEEIISCKWLPGTQYEAIRSEFSHHTSKRATVLENIRSALESINVTRENYVTLDYLFIPVLAAGHYVLYGFGIYPISFESSLSLSDQVVTGQIKETLLIMFAAPKQRKVFVVNSFPDDRFHRDSEYNRDTILAILRYLVPREDRSVWEMDVDIVRSSDERTDTRAVFQRDGYNCGVYVCTNALCLAFGYIQKATHDSQMKNGGFTGIYNYDIFELPQIPSANPATAMRYKVLLAAHKRRNGKRLPEGLDDTPLGSQESSPTSSTSNTRSQSSDQNSEESNEQSSESSGAATNDNIPSEEVVFSDDENDEETHGLDNIDIFTANLPTKKRKRTVPIPIFPTANQCLYIDNHLDEPRPESIKRPENSQFEASYGFMYPFYHVDFDEAIKCAREELIEACKNFPVANWERWCDFPKGFFLDWMLTEMGATMARIHKDPNLPMPGHGEGYEIWLKWRAEGKRNVQAKEAALLESSKQAEMDKEVGEPEKLDVTVPSKTSPSIGKSKDKNKSASPPRKSQRLASAKIRLAESVEEVVAETVIVMSALRGRPRKRQRKASKPSDDEDDYSKHD